MVAVVVAVVAALPIAALPIAVLPGGGAVISSFVSYALEKRVSRHPERFARGGAWRFALRNCNLRRNMTLRGTFTSDVVGFRVVVDPPTPS